MFNLNKINKALRLDTVRSHYVPSHKKINQNDVKVLQDFIRSSQDLLVLTGAGISTESGIPDYRSEEVGLYAKNGYRPMNYSEYMSKHSSRQRYWARNYLSWSYISNLKPNVGHLTLSDWQREGKPFTCITQNVDRLHHKAGTESIIELHGNLYTVKCIQCHHKISRFLFQKTLFALNRELLSSQSSQVLISPKRYEQIARPDGDVDVNSEFVYQFKYPDCDRCGGILKPDIVFFGDNVSQKLVQHIYQLVDQSDSILVIGSSLQVLSSYRFVLHAHQHNRRILIVNIGPTRADNLPNIVRLNVKIGDLLPQIKI